MARVSCSKPEFFFPGSSDTGAGGGNNQGPVNPNNAPGANTPPVPPQGADTINAWLAREAVNVPVINEIAAQRDARLARVAAGTATEADQAMAEEIAHRDQIIANNQARVDYYRNFTMEVGREIPAVNEYTSYDDQGLLVLPDPDTRPSDDDPWAAYFVDQTTIDVRGMETVFVDMMTTLAKINGEDAYSREALALGKLTESEYLQLPAGFPIPEVPVGDVGTGRAIANFNSIFLLGVYVLNKAVCPDPAHAVKFGLLRMEAVKMGWYVNQREAKIMPLPANLAEILRADRPNFEAHLKAAQKAAWMVPFANEHTFRTQGNHYISGQGIDYTDRCDVIFKASLAPEVSQYLPPDLLYHTALHWITPERTWNVLVACEHAVRMPDAIRIRKSSAPAGAALVTTTAAAIQAMKSSGVYDELVERNVYDFNGILALDEKIRSDPPAYHRMVSAYGKPALSADARAELARMKKEAEKLAPVAKAFCDTLMRNAPLGKQKVLGKAANINPVLYQRARRFFQNYSRAVPASVEENFVQRKRQRAGEDYEGSVVGARSTLKGRFGKVNR